jgi:DNA-binding protein YbaB
MKTAQNYLLIQEVLTNETGGLVDVKISGNSPILVDVIATAMESNVDVAMLIAYAHKEYENRKKGKGQRKRFVSPGIQISMF